MGGKTEVFYCNVKILLHHRPNSFHDKLSREADEGVSARGRFLHPPRLSLVNYSKGNNQLDETKRVLTSMIAYPQWKIWRDMGGQNEFLYCNVEILLHHRPNSFHDE